MDRLDFITPKINPVSKITIRNKYINSITLYPEGSPGKFVIAPAIKDIHQLEKELISGQSFSHTQVYHVFPKLFRVADTINARYGSNNQHVPSARKQGRGG